MAALVTAIDLGADSLKVVSVRRRRAGPEVVAAGRLSLADRDRNAPAWNDELAGALRHVVELNGIPVGGTVLGLSGKGTMLRYLAVPAVPPWKLRMVMAFEVEEQIGSAAGAQQIAWDYRILNLPDFDTAQFPILLALAQTPVVIERMAVAKAGARGADEVGLTALGAFHLFRRSPQCREDEISLLLDLGAEETHLTLQRGGELLFARTLSQGGRQLTGALQQKLGLLGPEAEAWKRSDSRILSRSDEERHPERAVLTSRICRAEAAALANAVQGSLRFFQNQFGLRGVQPARAFLTGGASRLAGLDEAFRETLRCEVESLDVAGALPATPVAAEALREDGPLYAAALGLALGQMEDGYAVSLLPRAVKERRHFWAATAYAGYAAAFAALLLLLLWLAGRREASYGEQRNQAWAGRVEAARAEHAQLEEARRRNDREWEKLQALRVREASGRDLLECLEHLRRETPPEICLTGLATAGELVDEEAQEPGEAKPATPPAGKEAGSFQDRRYILIQGVAAGAADMNAARDRVKAYADRLQALPFFLEVKVQRAAPLAAGAPELLAAYSLRSGAKGERGVAGGKPPSGAAIAFAFQCSIREF